MNLDMDVDKRGLSPDLASLVEHCGLADERILVEQSSNDVGHYHPRHVLGNNGLPGRIFGE